ncbi:MAG: hypothetical protein DRI23_04110 [Candidatus Cloacimonadota bacterium]|nr:MAG: hypothetical protein DRI23_04110 [Candidatus Cloacimonadota bacterium]RLC52283.1 MAG: hypothetical protein DRH79_05060 [Candidatus Cloacimonadota bacterium]
MKFIRNVFSRRSVPEPHNFSQLISGRERLIVFLPDDVLDSYQILCHLVVWKDLFKEMLIFVPQYSHTFFSRFNIGSNVKYVVFSFEKAPLIGSSILNFSLEKSIEKYLKNCKGSTIVDSSNKSNLQFIPYPKSALEILEKFAGFSNLPFQETHISFELTKAEHFTNKQKYFHNRFPDFVLNISSNVSSKKLDNLISNLKLSFSANIYLTHRSIKNSNFPNLESIELETLLQLYQYAISCNLFLTTDASLAGLLQSLNKTCLHLGTGFNSDNVKSVKINDFELMQGIVPQLMKKL